MSGSDDSSSLSDELPARDDVDGWLLYNQMQLEVRRGMEILDTLSLEAMELRNISNQRSLIQDAEHRRYQEEQEGVAGNNFDADVNTDGDDIDNRFGGDIDSGGTSDSSNSENNNAKSGDEEIVDSKKEVNMGCEEKVHPSPGIIDDRVELPQEIRSDVNNVGTKNSNDDSNDDDSGDSSEGHGDNPSPCELWALFEIADESPDTETAKVNHESMQVTFLSELLHDITVRISGSITIWELLSMLYDNLEMEQSQWGQGRLHLSYKNSQDEFVKITKTTHLQGVFDALSEDADSVTFSLVQSDSFTPTFSQQERVHTNNEDNGCLEYRKSCFRSKLADSEFGSKVLTVVAFMAVFQTPFRRSEFVSEMKMMGSTETETYLRRMFASSTQTTRERKGLPMVRKATSSRYDTPFELTDFGLRVGRYLLGLTDPGEETFMANVLHEWNRCTATWICFNRPRKLAAAIALIQEYGGEATGRRLLAMIKTRQDDGSLQPISNDAYRSSGGIVYNDLEYFRKGVERSEGWLVTDGTQTDGHGNAIYRDVAVPIKLASEEVEDIALKMLRDEEPYGRCRFHNYHLQDPSDLDLMVKFIQCRRQDPPRTFRPILKEIDRRGIVGTFIIDHCFDHVRSISPSFEWTPTLLEIILDGDIEHPHLKKVVEDSVIANDETSKDDERSVRWSTVLHLMVVTNGLLRALEKGLCLPINFRYDDNKDADTTPMYKQEIFLWVPHTMHRELCKGATTRNNGIAESDFESNGWHCVGIGSAVVINFNSSAQRSTPNNELSGYSMKDDEGNTYWRVVRTLSSTSYFRNGLFIYDISCSSNTIMLQALVSLVCRQDGTGIMDWTTDFAQERMEAIRRILGRKQLLKSDGLTVLETIGLLPKSDEEEIRIQNEWNTMKHFCDNDHLLGRMERWMNGCFFFQPTGHQENTRRSYARKKKKDWFYLWSKRKYTNSNGN